MDIVKECCVLLLFLDGISDGRRGFLITASVLLILLSLLSLVISAYTLYIAKLGIFHQRRFRVLFEIILAILILLFVIGYGNDEWCSQDWQWNVGAFCTCLSWLTLLVTLKGFRHTAPPINMLFAIIKNFLWIIYVPILLIVAFVLAFYMLFTIPVRLYLCSCSHVRCLLVLELISATSLGSCSSIIMWLSQRRLVMRHFSLLVLALQCSDNNLCCSL